MCCRHSSKNACLPGEHLDVSSSPASLLISKTHLSSELCNSRSRASYMKCHFALVFPLVSLALFAYLIGWLWKCGFINVISATGCETDQDVLKERHIWAGFVCAFVYALHRVCINPPFSSPPLQRNAGVDIQVREQLCSP